MTIVLLLILAGVVMTRMIGTDSSAAATAALNPSGSHGKGNVTVGPIHFQTVPFEVAYPHAGVVEVNDPETWATVWNSGVIHVCPINLPCPPPPPPPVNFTAETILVVSAGLEGSGGYRFNITNITGTDAKIVVDATLTIPGQNCARTLQLTYPGQSVEIPETNLPPILELTTAQAPACPLS